MTVNALRAIVEQAAHVERVALARAGDLEPAVHRLGALVQRLDLRQLVLGQRAQPARRGLAGR